MGSSLAFIDGSVVNVALAVVAKDLHATPSERRGLQGIGAALLLPNSLAILGSHLGSVFVAMGLALYERLGVSAVTYWPDVFPPTFLVAVGMAMIAAPLTTSVMESVDAGHVGIASGFNSAVARIGGLIATALLSYVFSRQASRAAFIESARLAAGFGSAGALLAAVCAHALLRNPETRRHL